MLLFHLDLNAHHRHLIAPGFPSPSSSAWVPPLPSTPGVPFLHSGLWCCVCVRISASRRPRSRPMGSAARTARVLLSYHYSYPALVENTGSSFFSLQVPSWIPRPQGALCTCLCCNHAHARRLSPNKPFYPGFLGAPTGLV
jgi:hypothetical protein